LMGTDRWGELQQETRKEQTYRHRGLATTRQCRFQQQSRLSVRNTIRFKSSTTRDPRTEADDKQEAGRKAVGASVAETAHPNVLSVNEKINFFFKIT